MNCNCNTHNNGGDAATTKTLNKIRRGNPFYINLAVTINGEPATEEQVRDISIYLVDERGGKIHLYDTTQSDNVISARVEGMERLGKYSAEIVYHPQGRKERVQDVKDVIEIVANSDDEQIDGQPINTEMLGINLTADMVVSLSASASTTTAVDVDTKIDALRNEMLTEIWTITSSPRPTTPPTPQTKIRIDTGKLQVSYDDGYSWVNINLSDVSVGVTHDGQYTASTLANLVRNPKLSALYERVTAIEGKTNAPQTKIRVSEDDYTLQVSYDGENHWETIDINNLYVSSEDGGSYNLGSLPSMLNNVAYANQIPRLIEQDTTLPSRSLKQLVYPKTNKVDAVDYRPTEQEKNGIDYVKELIRVINDYEHYASDRRARMGDFPLERHKSLRKEYLGFIGRIQDLEKMVELMRVKLNTLLPDGNKVDSDVSIIAG